MQEYVLGFAFNSSKNEVVLVRKNRPKSLAGLWNGIGGKIEDKESPYEAMIREFREEAGVYLINWTWISIINAPELAYRIFVYYTIDNRISYVNQESYEEVTRLNPENLPKHELAPNARWLIEFCLNRSTGIRLPIEIVEAGH